MDDVELTQWLLQNGGPAIRYRTATELVDTPTDVDIERLAAELLASPTTQLWLGRVSEPGVGFSGFHHSKPEAFENAASKLCDLGLRAGMAPLDEKMLPYRRWLEEQAQAISRMSEVNTTSDRSRKATRMALDQGNRWFEVVLVAARLAWMGYADEPVGALLSKRLDILHALATTGNHAIYIDQDTFGDYPNNSFRKRPFVDPRYNGILPSIHDLYSLAHFPRHLATETDLGKIDAVVGYILHPDYQALEDGYGVMRIGPRRYFSMGWSAHLPGYGGFGFDDGQAGMFVQRLELMAHFPTAIGHRWFQEGLAHLEGHRTDGGTYRFPGRYLKESPGGYWVSGTYMRLEENRRTPQALALDSTFRMCVIRSLVEVNA
jgi:hypothetical protein